MVGTLSVDFDLPMGGRFRCTAVDDSCRFLTLLARFVIFCNLLPLELILLLLIFSFITSNFPGIGSFCKFWAKLINLCKYV